MRTFLHSDTSRKFRTWNSFFSHYTMMAYHGPAAHKIFVEFKNCFIPKLNFILPIYYINSKLLKTFSIPFSEKVGAV